GLQQRHRLPARPLPGEGRLHGRAQVQGVPAAPPDPDAGLVQGLPGPHRRGPRAEPPHPRGPGSARARRAPGARVGGPAVRAHEVDYGDVQGLVRFGHGKLTEATYALVRVTQVEAARAWLRSAPVTSATPSSPPPPTAMQVAFTADGLEALGVPAAVRAGFSPEFLSGITEESRSRRLGDVGANDPSLWEWGGTRAVPHALVAFFAAPNRLAGFVQAQTGESWKNGFETLRSLETSQLDGIEPFGFADGISQPDLDWAQTRDL